MYKQPICIEVQKADGTVLFKINISERKSEQKRTEPEPSSPVSSAQPSAQPETTADIKSTSKQPGKREAKSDSESMTDAQKRYIFRLLADKKLEGEKAHTHLMNLLDVQSLKEITKFDASRVIEKLLEPVKGGGGNGSPE